MTEKEAVETQESTTTEESKGGETKVEVTVTTQDKAEGDETNVPEGADIIDEAKSGDWEYEPLFDEEKELTEADLSGIEKEESPTKDKEKESQEQSAEQKTEKEKQAAKELDEKKATEEAESKTKAEVEAKEKAETEAKTKEEAEKKAAREKTEIKPPEGYVPHAALHETREMLKEEKAERKVLEAKVDQLLAEKAEVELEPKMPDGFKVLTDEELDELIDDDPQEAQRYQAKLQRYESKKATAKQVMREQRRETESVVMTTVDRIEKAVPGIYDEEKSIGKDLADFAIKSGFKDESFLEVMTNPATIVIPAGTDKRVLLSNGAASLIEMLHKIHTSSAEGEAEEVDIEKIREEIRAEEKVALTASITKDLLAKLKPEHVPSEYRSIEELPAGSQEALTASTKQYTEVEWANLSEEDQVRLLGG